MSEIKWQKLSAKRKERLEQACQEYHNRKARISHPCGKFDNAGRWYPDKSIEEKDCCKSIRSPSRSYPYSMNLHCRSLDHVASLFEVDRSFLRKLAKSQNVNKS